MTNHSLACYSTHHSKLLQLQAAEYAAGAPALSMSTLAASSSSSTSSPRCVPFAFRRGGGGGRRGRLRQAPASAAPGVGGCGGCGRPLCRPAEVLGEGIQNAFFVSLDVCSCVTVRTDSFRESESEAAPLMSSTPPPHPHDAVRSGGTTGRRRASSNAGKPRRGLGCCTPNSTSVN